MHHRRIHSRITVFWAANLIGTVLVAVLAMGGYGKSLIAVRRGRPRTSPLACLLSPNFVKLTWLQREICAPFWNDLPERPIRRFGPKQHEANGEHGIISPPDPVPPPERHSFGPFIRYPVRMDISPPLRLMPIIPPGAGRRAARERENPPLPFPRHEEGPGIPDPVVQTWKPAVSLPTPSSGFDGINNRDGVLPPDTNGEIGPNHYVQMVNLSFAVYDRSGNLLFGPAATNTVWQGFGGPCETRNDGDPVVLYDQLADRWLISQFTASSPYYQCIAISQTSDPTGSWYRYAFFESNNVFGDYPKLGMWPDGYYMMVHQFQGGTWKGTGVYAFERSKMLVGDPNARQVYFDVGAVNLNYGGMLPADLDGSTPPPPGSCNYFAMADTSQLLLWKFCVDWNNPANSTFGTNGNPNATLAIAPWTQLCSGTRNCIPQPSPGVALDAIGDRLMFRMAYRNFGTHESLVLNHTVDAGGGRAGVRWYEIRDPGGSPTVYQQGTYAPADGLHRWMGSIAMDKDGNIMLGFSGSSSTVMPSIYFAGRLAGDPLGQMAQGEQVMMAGAGVQTHSSGRWGDYSDLTVDPVDDCTFWFTTEYYSATSSAGWKTRIGHIKFPSCNACTPPNPPSGLTATPNGNNRIDLAWTASTTTGIAEYRIYRATVSGGPYTQIATVPGTVTSYSDTTVSGGTTYYYVVRAFKNCESADSNEASATATGACTAAPTFGGLVSARNNKTATCGITLTWNPATANCGGPVVYSIYRSTTSGFTPSAANQIAMGVTGTSFTDTVGLSSATVYYYIVRAVDLANGTEDANTVEKSTIVYGPPVPTVLYSNDFETSAADWGEKDFGGTADSWRGVQTCTAASGTKIYRFGGNGCNTNYASNNFRGAEPQSTSGISIPVTAENTRWTFNHRWQFETETTRLAYDGGTLGVSFNGSNYSLVQPSEIIGGTGYTHTIDDACNPGGVNGMNVFSGNQTTFTSTTVDLEAICQRVQGSPCAGKTIWTAFIANTDCSVTRDGWFLDDVTLQADVGSSCTGVATVKPVPDGRYVSGNALQVTKNGTGLTVTWDTSNPSCKDAAYHLFYGYGSGIAKHTLAGSVCNIGTSGSFNWTAPAVPPGESFIWFVVVGSDGGNLESIWGHDSTGQPFGTTASGQCGSTGVSNHQSCP